MPPPLPARAPGALRTPPGAHPRHTYSTHFQKPMTPALLAIGLLATSVAIAIALEYWLNRNR